MRKLEIASSIQHQASNIKHQTSNIKHQTSNIKHQKKWPEQFISRILFLIRITQDQVTIIHLWMPVARHLLQPTRELGRATLGRSSIWSCTEWGLQSFPSRPGNWCALTDTISPLPTER